MGRTALFHPKVSSDRSEVEPLVVAALKECLDELQSNWRLTGYPVVLLGTTADRGRVPSGLLNCFKHDINFEVYIFDVCPRVVSFS